METKHTPGPWSVVPKPVGTYGKNWLEIQSNNRPVIHAGAFERTRDGETETHFGVVIKEADAKLIASAPQLLESLKYARRFLKPEDHDVKYVDEIIALATGSEVANG